MPGYDDPRYVQQVIEGLKREIAELRQKTLPLAVHQRGPIPGFMRAVQINDPGQASSMWMNLVGNTPGQAPYLATSDPNGVVRAELGNLAANGISPAFWGFRANAADGSPIFDSLGLIAVMKVLGTFTDNTADQITSTTPVVLDSVSVTFTLARAANVLALASSVGKVAGASGTFCFAQMTIDGNFHGTTAVWDKNANAYQTSVMSHFINLAVGSHTIDVRFNVDNAALTWTNFQTSLTCYLLGT